MMRLLAALLLLPGLALAAQAPDTPVVTGPNNAQVPIGNLLITPPGGTQQKLGDALANSSGSSVTPTGAPTALPLPTIASQQGVLLDAFRLASDPDDTASMTRAVAAGVPILLGAKTYFVHDYAMVGAPASFTLVGVRGQSVIQRTSANGSVFFQIKAAKVLIDGVTFDENSDAVSANQWGVLLNQGGQDVTVRNSVFKNNSGTLGSCFAITSTGPGAGGSFNFTGNEVSNCSQNAALFGSVSAGVVANNWVHDVATGINVTSYLSASATNYAANVVVSNNRVARASGNAINVGGLGPPFVFGTPAAVNVDVIGNDLEDAVIYGISLEGDYLSAIGNHVSQSSPSVVVLGGIDTLSRYGRVQNNTVTFAGINFGIDIGGSQGMLITGNIVTMNQGSAYNTGGNLNTAIRDNVANLTGTAIGVTNYNVEGSGGSGFFPTISSNTSIENNTFNISGTSASGVNLYDNSGGGVGASPNVVRSNRFDVTGSGSGPSQDITWYGSPHSLNISGNLHNGSNLTFADPNGSGDVIFDNVYYGGSVIGISSTTNIRSIQPTLIATYGAGGSILWVSPSAGGSGYVCSTTTLAASGSGGGSGWTGTPLCSGGAIIGVKTTAKGSGYSGTITVTATDTSGGTGSTFTVGNIPLLPDAATLYVQSVTSHLVLKGGAFIPFLIPFPIAQTTNSNITLQAIYGGTQWSVLNYIVPTFAIGSLPPSNATTCTSTWNGALANVTGSVSGKWQSRCNGTNWIAPDGTTIN